MKYIEYMKYILKHWCMQGAGQTRSGCRAGVGQAWGFGQQVKLRGEQFRSVPCQSPKESVPPIYVLIP